MALRLITEGEFRASRYGQVADQIDGRLSDIIEQAENYIESILDRRIAVETYTETVTRRTRTSLYLRETPIVDVVGIDARRDASASFEALSLTSFTIDTRLGILTTSDYDLSRFAEVQVLYDAGYAQVPPLIKMAVILQTAYFAYQDFEIYGTGDAKEPGIRYIQRDIHSYLKPFKRDRLV